MSVMGRGGSNLAPAALPRAPRGVAQAAGPAEAARAPHRGGRAARADRLPAARGRGGGGGAHLDRTVLVVERVLERMAEMHRELDLEDEVDVERIRGALEELADELMVDVNLEAFD